LNFSFSRADRILKRAEFLRLSGSGKKLHSRYLIGNYCEGTSDRTRLGITVTKKVGNAVVRNRLKRLTREYFRLNRPSIAGCRDINIIVKKQAVTLSSDQFFSAIRDIFDRINNDGH